MLAIVAKPALALPAGGIAGRAAKLIQDALGIASDDVVNYTFPKSWPEDREQRARIIGDWLQTEARYLV